MKLFPDTVPLEFLSIEILRELIRTSPRNGCLVVITDRFTKIVRAVPLRNRTASIAAHAFVHNLVFV